MFNVTDSVQIWNIVVFTNDITLYLLFSEIKLYKLRKNDVIKSLSYKTLTVLKILLVIIFMSFSLALIEYGLYLYVSFFDSVGIINSIYSFRIKSINIVYVTVGILDLSISYYLFYSSLLI